MNKAITIELLEKNGSGEWTESLEKSIYNRAVDLAIERSITRKWSNDQFTTLYSSLLYFVISNLPKIISALNAKLIAPEAVCSTDIMTIDPDIYKDELKIIGLKLEQKIEERYSNRYICPKCKTNKIKIEERQTSALDEISKFFKLCCNPACKFKWT